MSDGFFLLYILMLLVSAALLGVLAARGYGLGPGRRSVSAVVAAAFVVQAVYLVFFFGGGEYTMSLWAFIGPIYAVTRMVRHRRAVREQEQARAGRLWGPGGMPTHAGPPPAQQAFSPQGGYLPQQFVPGQVAFGPPPAYGPPTPPPAFGPPAPPPGFGLADQLPAFGPPDQLPAFGLPDQPAAFSPPDQPAHAPSGLLGAPLAPPVAAPRALLAPQHTYVAPTFTPDAYPRQTT